MKTSTTRFPIIVTALALAALTSCGGGGGGNGYSMAPPGGGAKELNSGDFGAGGTFSHTFATAGTYNYHCVHHGAMTGSVVVDAAAAGTTASVSIASSSAPFPAATVKPGGQVTWTNNTTSVHTVTSN